MLPSAAKVAAMRASKGCTQGVSEATAVVPLLIAALPKDVGGIGITKRRSDTAQGGEYPRKTKAGDLYTTLANTSAKRRVLLSVVVLWVGAR